MRRVSPLKKFFAAAALLLLLFSLTACSGSGLTAQDAADYTKGLLDATYHGVFDEAYLEQVDLTETQARKSYEKGLEVSYSYLSKNFQFDETYLTEETRQEAIDLLADIYARARYQVQTPSKTEDGFIVEVTIQPIDIIPLVVENYMEAYTASFADKYSYMTQETAEALPEENKEAFWSKYENDWAMGIIELFRTHLGELGHLEPVSILVQFEPDADGYYAMSDTDFANLDSLILAYTKE